MIVFLNRKYSWKHNLSQKLVVMILNIWERKTRPYNRGLHANQTHEIGSYLDPEKYLAFFSCCILFQLSPLERRYLRKKSKLILISWCALYLSSYQKVPDFFHKVICPCTIHSAMQIFFFRQVSILYALNGFILSRPNHTVTIVHIVQ